MKLKLSHIVVFMSVVLLSCSRYELGGIEAGIYIVFVKNMEENYHAKFVKN